MSPSAIAQLKGRPARPPLSHGDSILGWDQAIEESILGALLMFPKTVPIAFEILSPDDFFLPGHQAVFEVISRLHSENVVIDPFSVHDRLQSDGFEASPDRNDLLLLAQLPTIACEIRHQAEILKRQAVERETKRVTQLYLSGELGMVALHQAIGQLLERSAPSASPILSLAELLERTPSEPEWIVRGLLARESITDLAAKIKLGKTHFTLAMIAAILRGQDFLGIPTTRTRVLYLTEERQPTFSAACRRVGLKPGDNLHVLLRSDAPRDWNVTGAIVLREAKRLSVGLVVIDTLSDWAGLKADEENDAGTALAAMRPLQAIAAAGPAVIDLRHDRKGPSADLADSSRGSSAFGGAADILLGLRPATGAGHPNRRQLIGLGRFDDVPADLAIELVDGKYVFLGEGRGIAKRDARQTVLGVLPRHRGEAVSTNEISELCSEVRDTTLKETLKQLVAEGLVRRERPLLPDPRAFGYWLASDGEL